MRNERGQFVKGNNGEWVGKKHKPLSRMKMSLAKKGKKGYWKGKKRNEEEKSCNWKGDQVGYVGIHYWVKKWKGSPDVCEGCGRSGLKEHSIHWANIDHKYRRVLEDYIRLCVKCHKAFDNKFNLNNKNEKN